jgi:hypothetical protein
MEATTIRAITRPVICFIFIASWTAMIFFKVDYPNAYWIMACLAGLEWISERAVKRFKEIFGGG